MGKAFAKESDGGVPEGFKNYITPGGYRRLHDELDQLWKVERPKLGGGRQ